MKANTTAASPNTGPTTDPAIEAFSEGCCKGSVGDDVSDVNTNEAGVADVLAGVIVEVEVGEVDVEVDETDKRLLFESDVGNDEVFSATHLETCVRGRSCKEACGHTL